MADKDYKVFIVEEEAREPQIIDNISKIFFSLGRKVNEDVIHQMLESFDNETENGKLYISYPMVEALRDYELGKCGNGVDCFVEIEDLGNYKNASAARARNPHFKEYGIDAWKEIIDVFAMRISCLYKIANTMEYEQYSGNVTPENIYAAELKEAERHRVFVLSAFPEFLLDYFGLKLWKTSVRHARNQRNKLECKKAAYVSKKNGDLRQ